MVTFGFFFMPFTAAVDLALHPAAGERQLLTGDRERDHHLDDGVLALGAQLGRSGHEGPHLHGVQAGLHDAEAHAAGADHRVVLGPLLGGLQLGRSSLP